MTDGELLTCHAREGREECFAELLRRHGPMVSAACRRLVGEADAEDAAQAVFILLLRKAQGLAGQDDLGPWLYLACGFVARAANRESLRRRAREKEAAEMRRNEPTAGVPEASRVEVEAELDSALADLPERYRRVVVLCHLEGATQAEAARRLRLPLGTVAFRCSKGLERLRERLERRRVTVGAAALEGLLLEGAAKAAAAFRVESFLPSVLAASQSAATLVAAGSAGQGALWAEGAVRIMFWTKCKAAAICLAAAVGLAGLGGAGYVLGTAGEHAGRPPDADADAETIVVEAESADKIEIPFQVMDDPLASGGKYLTLPSKGCDGEHHRHIAVEGTPERIAGKAQIGFEVRRAGTYYVWVRRWWCCSCGDSLVVLCRVFGNDSSQHRAWGWSRLTDAGGERTKLKYDTGRHSMMLANRGESGFRIDQIVLTTDPEFVPEAGALAAPPTQELVPVVPDAGKLPAPQIETPAKPVAAGAQAAVDVDPEWGKASDGLKLRLRSTTASLWLWPHWPIPKKGGLTSFYFALDVQNVSGDDLRLVPVSTRMLELIGPDGKAVEWESVSVSPPRDRIIRDMFPTVSPSDAELRALHLTGDLYPDGRVKLIDSETGKVWRSKTPLAPGKYTASIIYANDGKQRQVEGRAIEGLWTGRVVSGSASLIVYAPGAPVPSLPRGAESKPVPESF